MMRLALIAAAACLAVTPALAGHKHSSGTKDTPGHEMQEHGSKPGSPGASGYAPGHEKASDERGSASRR